MVSKTSIAGANWRETEITFAAECRTTLSVTDTPKERTRTCYYGPRNAKNLSQCTVGKPAGTHRSISRTLIDEVGDSW